MSTRTTPSLSFSGLRLRGRGFHVLAGWSGKPIHPSVASVPMGTTVAAVVFDVASALSAGSSSLDRELYRSATFVLMVGQAFVALAVLTGWWDRRRLTSKTTAARAAANAHAWMMLAFGAWSFCEIVVRQVGYPDASRTPGLALVMTILLATMALAGGTLGGTLTFEHGLAVESHDIGDADRHPQVLVTKLTHGK